MPATKVLIINPNSTSEMTDGLRQAPVPQPDIEYHFFTNPDGPPSIDDEDTCHASAESCMKALLDDQANGVDLTQYGGFVVACYSLHPLVNKLKAETGKPAVGIFEASVTTCLHLIDASQKFGIVSTGNNWETLLTEGVAEILGAPHADGGTRFAGVGTTGLTASALHKATHEEAQQLMKDATKRLLRDQRNQGDNRNLVGAICLGCAAMTGLQKTVREACNEELGEERGSRIFIVDGVSAATGVVLGLVRMSLMSES
ncbi:Asp/Glu/hydantoin racemase [Melanogaster broomeanus]|nr:Asp/Glu/hydantoin racemase [Melanogaster broomeanus]